MVARVRAADPATLFRPGGTTIADHMKRAPVPLWVPAWMEHNYRLDVFFYGEHRAAHHARLSLSEKRA